MQRNEIRRKLATHNITLTSVAILCGCTPQHISKYFSGHIKTDKKGIVKVSIRLIRAAKRKEEVTARVLDEL